MDSDDRNISDHVGDLDIQPYQFEPLCNDESQQERNLMFLHSITGLKTTTKLSIFELIITQISVSKIY